MKKKLIIVGIILAVVILFFFVYRYVTDPSNPALKAAPSSGGGTSGTGGQSSSSSSSRSSSGSSTALTVIPPGVNDSIEANRNGVRLYDTGMNPVGTKNKNQFIGTVLNRIDYGDPTLNVVKFRTSDNVNGYVYEKDVKVHNL